MATRSPETQKRVKSVLKALKSKADKRTAAKAAAKANMTPAERARVKAQKPEVRGMKTKAAGQQRVSLKAKMPLAKTAAKMPITKTPSKALTKASSTALKAPSKPNFTRSAKPAKVAKLVGKKGAVKAAAKGAGKALGKVAAPIAAAAEVAKAGQLAVSKEARDKASADLETMGEKNTFMRQVESALSPVKTIYAAGAALKDIASNDPVAHQRTLDAAVDPAQRAASAAKGAKRDAIMAEAFSPEEFQKINKSLLASDPEKWNKLMNSQSVEEARSYGGDGGIPDDASFGDSVEKRMTRPDLPYSYEGYQEKDGWVPNKPQDPYSQEAIDAGSLGESKAMLGYKPPNTEGKLDPYSQEAIDAGSLEPTIQDEVPPVQDVSSLVPTDKAGALDPYSQEAIDAGSLDKVGDAPAIRDEDPEVEPLSEESSAVSLFSTVHGGPFDPNSSMDRAKLAKIQSLLDKNGGTLSGMTPNQFALKIYRQG